MINSGVLDQKLDNSTSVLSIHRKPQTYSPCTRKHKKVTENRAIKLLAIYKKAFGKMQRIAKILNLLSEIFCSERERTAPFMIFFIWLSVKTHINLLTYIYTMYKVKYHCPNLEKIPSPLPSSPVREKRDKKGKLISEEIGTRGEEREIRASSFPSNYPEVSQFNCIPFDFINL